MTQAFTQGEPNLVKDPIETSSDTSLSLPETLSLPSTPSISQTQTTPFPPNFPTNLDNRYKEHLTNNLPLRLDWNTFVAPLHYLINILTVTDYIIGHSADYKIDTIFTKTYKNTTYKSLHKTILLLNLNQQ